jgi:hypothetical protein
VYNKKDALVYNCAKAIFAANHSVELIDYTENEVEYLNIIDDQNSGLNQKLYTLLIGSICLKKLLSNKCNVLYEKDLLKIQEMLDESYEMETGVDLNCMSPAQEESYSK